MTPKEFGELAAAIKTYFPRDNIIPTDRAMDLWYEELKDLPYAVAQISLRKYVATNKFPPTIADIRENAVMEEEQSELAAWHLVYKAICDSAYHAEERFDELPETIRRAVASPENLREWGQMKTETVNSVIQSQFLSSYRAEVKRAADLRKLSADLLRQCGIDVDKQQDVPKKIEKEETIVIEKKGYGQEKIIKEGAYGTGTM